MRYMAAGFGSSDSIHLEINTLEFLASRYFKTPVYVCILYNYAMKTTEHYKSHLFKNLRNLYSLWVGPPLKETSIAKIIFSIHKVVCQPMVTIIIRSPEAFDIWNVKDCRISTYHIECLLLCHIYDINLKRSIFQESKDATEMT